MTKPKKRKNKQQGIAESPFKEPDQDYNLLPPIFSFHYMSYGTTYCLSKCTDNDKAAIALRLVQLSRFTWKQIASESRKTYGNEQIPLRQFRASKFPSIVTADVNSLMVFRYSQAGRIAGLKKNNIYHIIFVGPDIYKH